VYPVCPISTAILSGTSIDINRNKGKTEQYNEENKKK
jgi:hypothetical protein